MSPEGREQYLRAIAEHARRYGMGLSTHKRELTAIHEAGHALCKHLAGRKARSKIWQDKSNKLWFGWTDSGSDQAAEDFSQNDKAGLGYGVFVYAGIASEIVIGRSKDFGSSTDEVFQAKYRWEAHGQRLGINLRQVIMTGQLGTMALINRYKREVSRIANVLKHGKRVSPEQVARILRNVPQGNGYETLWEMVEKEIKRGPAGM